MRRRLWAMAMAVGIGAGLAMAARTGYSRVFAMPESGEVEIVNSQANTVWRLGEVAVVFPDTASRTVTVYRVSGEMEYPIAAKSATARTFVYEFEAGYWSGMSNGVKVVARPASTGLVEAIYE